MTTEVSPPFGAGTISVNWYDITFEDCDSYVGLFDHNHRLEWLQSGVQQLDLPKKPAEKVLVIKNDMCSQAGKDKGTNIMKRRGIFMFPVRKRPLQYRHVLIVNVVTDSCITYYILH